MSRWRHGPPRDLSDGPNGDLWRRVRRYVPTRWIKSHQTEEEARSRGYALVDWEGNRKADEAAGRWATSTCLAEAQQKQRTREVEAVLLYQKLVAAVQHAAVANTVCRDRRWRRKKVHLPSLAARGQRRPLQGIPAPGERP